MRIGGFPEWSTGAARDRTRKLRMKVDTGHDPLEELEAAREAPTLAGADDRLIGEEGHQPDKRGLQRLVLSRSRARGGALGGDLDAAVVGHERCDGADVGVGRTCCDERGGDERDEQEHHDHGPLGVGDLIHGGPPFAEVAQRLVARDEREVTTPNLACQ